MFDIFNESVDMRGLGPGDRPGGSGKKLIADG
jgi:hypothetical protein